MTTSLPPTLPAHRTRERRLAELEPLLQQRILVLDGAMGTMIQSYQLSEREYRGSQFSDHPGDLRSEERRVGKECRL